MAKIEVTPITSGYNVAALNETLQNIEDEFKNKVVYRDEVSPMERALDMNGKDILNVDSIVATSIQVGGAVITEGEFASDSSAILRGDLSAPAGSALVGFQQRGDGAVPRTVEGKAQECVTVLDFIPEEHHDAIRAGTSLYDCGAAFSLAATYAAIVTRVGTANNDIVTAAVEIPAGVYRSSLSLPIKNAVQWHGAGSGATCIVITGAVNGFTVDDPLRDYSNVRFTGFTLENGGSAIDGITGSGLLRNCGAEDVVVKGFRDSYSLTDTWTFKLNDCASYSATRHHIHAGADTGGIHIYGGRYDVCESYGVYMNSQVGELIMHDVAVQFGRTGAVWVDDARTVELKQCFFEGNCITNPAAHYVTLKRIGANALSSATVEDCVMNNLADANRNGLGVLRVENFRLFVYRERWTRNDVAVVPSIGEGVEQVTAEYATANDPTPLLTNIGVGLANQAHIKRTARPQGIYGQDMADVSFAPTTRAALNVGFPAVGVALGTHGSTGAVNGYGASSVLKLNPAAGDIQLGQGGATVAGGTNEFFGKYRAPTQITSANLIPNATTQCVLVNCSGGNRNIQLTNIAHAAGRTITVKKTDASANLLIVSPTSGGTIDGAASFTSAAAYASIRLISDGVDWFSV